jgi:hypothetical protein
VQAAVISHTFTDTFEVLQGEIANIRIPLLDVNIENNIAMGIVMAYHYSKFMIATGEIVPDQTVLAGAMLGLLLNSIYYTRILEGPGELISHCIKSGFRPIFVKIVEFEDLLCLPVGVT